MKKPFIQFIGLPGSGKSCVGKELDRFNDLINNLTQPTCSLKKKGGVFCTTAKLLVFGLVGFLSVFFFRFWQVSPKKLVSTLRKFWQVYIPRSIKTIQGEGSVTLLARLVSLTILPLPACQLLLNLVLKTETTTFFVVLTVCNNVSIKRIESKKQKGVVNNLFFISPRYRRRYNIIIQSVIYNLSKTPKQYNYVIFNSSQQSCDEIAKKIKKALEATVWSASLN